MKEKAMSRTEIRDFIIWYITDKTANKTLKERRLLEKFIKEELDVTEEILRSGEIPNGWPFDRYKDEMTTELFKDGRCADLAAVRAKAYVDVFGFAKKEIQKEYCGYEWEKDDEQQLINWLLCECDTAPPAIPKRHEFSQPISDEPEEMIFAAMSNVFDFPVRYCAYALYGGVIDQFKYPFRGLILYREDGYADSVIERIKKIYADDFKADAERADSDIKTGFAAIYCCTSKTKAETAFYKKYIDKWMEEDRERFLGLFRVDKPLDVHKKILKKLTGSAK